MNAPIYREENRLCNCNVTRENAFTDSHRSVTYIILSTGNSTLWHVDKFYMTSIGSLLP